MPALFGRLDWDAGLVWRIGIVIDPVADRETVHICDALVDTGASQTCIARSVIDALGLESIGKAGMNTAGGPVAEVNLYDVHVALVAAAQDPDGSREARTTVFRDVRVAEFVAHNQDRCQVLIGRDILRIGVLTLSPDGRYAFAF